MTHAWHAGSLAAVCVSKSGHTGVSGVKCGGVGHLAHSAQSSPKKAGRSALWNSFEGLHVNPLTLYLHAGSAPHSPLPLSPAALCPPSCCCAALSPAQTFEVTCTKPQTGWPADFTAVGGAFTAGTADCEAPTTTSIPVSIATKPVVSITGPTEPKQVCSNASDVTVSYTVSSGTAGTPLTVTAGAKSAANVALDTVECTLPAAQRELPRLLRSRGY
jgi:hypothetical protein